jgi:hypothetical protein
MVAVDSKEKLMNQINKKRKELIKHALELDFTDQRVIHLSQELDQLLFKYQSRQSTLRSNPLLNGRRNLK